MKAVAFAAFAALALIPAVASADISIIVGPGNIAGDENVQYNSLSLADNALLVQGDTNDTATIVDFFDAGETLTTPSSGQARIEAGDGALTAMSIALHDTSLSFTSLILNLNADDDGFVTFTVSPVGEASHVETFALDKNGENFFRIIATNGESISLVSFTTTVDIEDIKQVRIGGMAPVPEPASLAALSVGALALLRRKRRAAK
ncbi:MAG: hypothetical protein QOJ65_2266 [Fimbriimonadaceae bacterium]|nr:hypothetical protein [Fimbriimonadaceae bacterium]